MNSKFVDIKRATQLATFSAVNSLTCWRCSLLFDEKRNVTVPLVNDFTMNASHLAKRCFSSPGAPVLRVTEAGLAATHRRGSLKTPRDGNGQERSLDESEVRSPCVQP